MGGQKDYLVGRGRVFINRFLDGTTTPTGEYYFGNTPTLNTGQAITNLDHYDADRGLRDKDYTLELENTETLTFTCDDMSPENYALRWKGALTTETQIVGAPVVYPINDALLDRYYQLGSTPTLPQGVRNFSAMSMTKGVTPVVATGNFEVDLANGRVYILPTAVDIDPGDDLSVSATPASGSRLLLTSGRNTIYGSMRFISANEGKKKQRHFFWPYVKLSADGDMALKGDDWQNIPFTAELLILPGYERVYADMPLPVVTP